ncbi:MAG: molybdopterin-guanine dinucleotide biosynthesis protein [Clostridiales bacterium]|jgi:GTP:adenosylcobinamide-phosphate guanylyltransferase|nr:molybdopterin-guanine dinucleotide biosynthesis protein [Clostridiales bacterium]
MVNAVILAGDREENGGSKALMMILSKYMIEYVIDSLRESGCVRQIYVVGNEELKDKVGNLVDGWIEAGGGIMDNIRRGVELIGDLETPCIISTSDIPMVKGEAIRDFVEKCQLRSIDFGYPIIDKRLNVEKYPDVKRTYVKMKEGTYTGGNIVYFNPKIVENCTRRAEQLIEYRKKPLKMGRVLGFTFLIRLALGNLSISKVEDKIQRMFDIHGEAILTNYPEIGNDVDKPSDVEFVNKHMEKLA